MPNHIHMIVSFIASGQSINTIVGNGKRFMAYEIIKRLTASMDYDLLNRLASAVEQKHRDNNKKHEMWELSFDWKLCENMKFADQKLSYMYMNPCSKKRNLLVRLNTYTVRQNTILQKRKAYPMTNIAENAGCSIY